MSAPLDTLDINAGLERAILVLEEARRPLACSNGPAWLKLRNAATYLEKQQAQLLADPEAA